MGTTYAYDQITNAAAVHSAFSAAADLLDQHPADTFSVFAAEGYPLHFQMDRMGGDLVQAMANGCGAPTYQTMRLAFAELIMYARTTGRPVDIPKRGELDANTGNYRIGQTAFHY